MMTSGSGLNLLNRPICVSTGGKGADKEVIQPQVPLRLPCYDFTPVTKHTVAAALIAVKQAASGAFRSHGVTGGVYKARERTSCRLQSGLRNTF